MKPLARLYINRPLAEGNTCLLEDKQAHYVASVMRGKMGDHVRLFNGRDGEWVGVMSDIRKQAVTLTLERQHAPQMASLPMIVCFAPPRGGRIDSIIEKATELGAGVLQPVRTQFSVVDKINEEKWRATAREAAEQCERMDLPEIRPMVTLPQLLGNWPQDVPLLHADESGAGVPFFSSPLEGEPQSALRDAVGGGVPTPPTEPAALRLQVPAPPQGGSNKAWGILVGPEGGFSGEERALIGRVKAARGVSLGPRILRVDTAVITLCALSAARWGDWDRPPHFEATS